MISLFFDTFGSMLPWHQHRHVDISLSNGCLTHVNKNRFASLSNAGTDFHECCLIAACIARLAHRGSGKY
jgi:hypothetical protein